MKKGSVVKHKSTGEIGVVVHSWMDEGLDSIDCHIAFYGDKLPEGKPIELPYILRYMASSLEVISE